MRSTLTRNVLFRRALSTTPVRSSPPAAAALARAPEEPVDTIKTAAQWAQFGRDHVSHGLGRLRDHVIVKGSGLELSTAEGKRLLDFTAGIGVTNLGQ